MSDLKSGRVALFTGALAAVLASACCLGPLLLVTLGLTGAWIGNLSALGPYRPAFIAGAIFAIFYAWRRIFRPTANCLPDQVCANGAVRTSYRLLFGIVVVMVLVAAGFPHLMPLFY